MRASGNPQWEHLDLVTADHMNNIENALRALETVTNLPSPGTIGRIVRLSSDGKLYVDQGTSWSQVSSQQELEAHLNNKNNPHSVTKNQVGLGNVQNYGVASKAEAEAGTASNKYMTPLRTKEAIEELAVSGGKRTVRFVVGTSTAGWTEDDVDYLCDGTDDQVEINQAIENLPFHGGEIVILDGMYMITEKINVDKNNIKIRGSGNATVLRRMYNSVSNGEGVITLDNAYGCTIANLQVDGNRGVYALSDNYGIYLTSSSNNTVTGNTCNASYHGIRLSSSSNNTVTDNTCNDNDYGGISLYSSSNNNTITGNTCNNSFNNGIYLSSSSNSTITGNTCNDNNSAGIYLGSSSNNTITGNTCHNNNYEGIYLGSSSNNNTITGNTCNNNNYGGISLISSCDDNVVVGNNTMGSATGIINQGSGNVVEANKR